MRENERKRGIKKRWKRLWCGTLVPMCVVTALQVYSIEVEAQGNRAESIIGTGIAAAMKINTVINNEETFTEGYFKYAVRGEKVSILLYFGREQEVSIPDHLAGLPVTEVESGTFQGNIATETVIIPEEVTKLGEGLFTGMPMLQEVFANQRA